MKCIKRKKQRVLCTTPKETAVLENARSVLFEMVKATDGHQLAQNAYQHLSILLARYRFTRKMRVRGMGRVRRFFYDLYHGRV